MGLLSYVMCGKHVCMLSSPVTCNAQVCSGQHLQGRGADTSKTVSHQKRSDVINKLAGLKKKTT